MEEQVDKEALVKLTSELKIKHEEIKAEMIKLLEASQTLELMYKGLEEELYGVEEKYIEAIKKLI